MTKTVLPPCPARARRRCHGTPQLAALLVLLLTVGCGDEPVVVTYTLEYPRHAAPLPPAPHLPNQHPPVEPPQQQPKLAVDGNDRFAWTAPDGWAPKPIGPMQMRIGSFAVPGPEGSDPGDCSIIFLGGSAGGLEANVNRWRGQLGLEPAGIEAVKALLQPVDMPDGSPAHLVVLSAAADREPAPSDQSMLIGMLDVQDGTLFAKLFGQHSTVDAARPAFEAFLKSVKAK